MTWWLWLLLILLVLVLAGGGWGGDPYLEDLDADERAKERRRR